MGTDAPRSKKHRRFTPVLISLSVVGILVVIAGGVGVWTVTRSFPTLSGEIAVPGLGSDVTVYRDDAGIPQIVAQSSSDLFRAQGYVHAQDRFWEMDFRRHVTSGRLAELFGESQVDTDVFVRTLGWRAIAEQEVALLDPVTLGYYQAYADGVNAYLDTHSGADLSLEYAVLDLQNSGYTPEKWTPADSVAWLKAMAWDLRSNLDDEIDRALLSTDMSASDVDELHPAYSWATQPTIVGGMPAVVADPLPDADGEGESETDSTGIALAPLGAPLSTLRAALSSVPELLGPAGGGIGSNSWVVSGTHTDTGKPLLANDPHLGPALPSVWYQVGLRCATLSADCPFDVAGYSFSGMPGVIIGHNARIAWGLTNLGPDVADLYMEKVTGDSYEYDGVQKPLTVRNEKINVAGGEPVKIEIRSTEHGPIVSGLVGTQLEQVSTEYPVSAEMPDLETAEPDLAADGDEPTYELALQWTALTPGVTASAIFSINLATDWASFRAAAAQFEVPSQNLIYADIDGNIGYQAPGSIPIRRSGDGTLPVPGWTSEYGWEGTVPFDQLPSLYNPPSGVIVTANNAVASAESELFLTADWDAGYRATQITTRIQTLIDSGTLLTASDMSDIQADNRSAIAAALVPHLLAMDTTRSSATTSKAQALLDGWDFSVDADSAAAAYFNIVWATLLDDMFSSLPDGTALTGNDRSFQVVIGLLDKPDSPWWTNTRTGVTGRDAILGHAMEDAAAEAADLMGPRLETWEWGRIHTLTLANSSFGTSGIGPIEWLFNRGPYEVGGGSSVVNATAWTSSEGYTVDWVPSMRQVISLADFDSSTWINLTGASGHAYHPNYTDQAPLWQKNATRDWLFSQSLVETASTNTLVLTPTESR
ncbi:penicillin acylase family protein [Leifsonia sp. A12D58]|uniref:penicillin acylase family protein n=1 Tax=Leifsonia sp. A12D58 TaxID=3397674 RepID=UPI0039E0090B